jgi:non-homologous end joining protein Ku
MKDIKKIIKEIFDDSREDVAYKDWKKGYGHPVEQYKKKYFDFDDWYDEKGENIINKIKDKMKQNYTYLDDEYEGHNNERIISLINDLNDCFAEKKRIEEEIKEIQNNCIHEFLLETKGMYENTYSCKHCGHTTKK